MSYTLLSNGFMVVRISNTHSQVHFHIHAHKHTHRYIHTLFDDDLCPHLSSWWSLHRKKSEARLLGNVLSHFLVFLFYNNDEAERFHALPTLHNGAEYTLLWFHSDFVLCTAVIHFHNSFPMVSCCFYQYCQFIWITDRIKSECFISKENQEYKYGSLFIPRSSGENILKECFCIAIDVS